ncbi:MAG: NYN domain-containing protein, partial [Selenomonadaceae bacterium]|nr:NYN domain-containing protein [Selenomonadaceae bacterium]
MPAKKIALFIDADNISSRHGKQILDTLESRGEIFIRRIYGNWEKVPLHAWNDCVLNFSLRAVQQPDFATGKNATDMSLTIDAMDVLHEGKAEIFALVSNDSDFTPLAIRLREGGMKVIGLGNAHASAAFRAACHEFVDLDAAEEIQNPQPSKVEKKSSAEKKSDVQLSLFGEENVDRFQSDADKIQAIHDALREATELHGDAEGFVLLNYGRLVLRGKNFGFTVKDFGYGQLRDFIVAFPEVYEVKGEGKDFSYRCRVAQIPQPTHDAEKILDAAKLQPIHDTLHEVVQLHGDEKGFALLSKAGDALGKKNLSVKDSGHSTLKNFLAAFPNLYEVTGEAPNIFYRCLTLDRLQPIHDTLHEVAATHGDADGFTNLGLAGSAFGQKNLSLKDSGHSSLSKLISAFPNLYEVKVDNGAYFYRCLPLDKLQLIHDTLREVAAVHGDEKGFVLLSWVGDALIKKNLSLKGSEYGTLKNFLGAFPNLYEVKGAGTEIFYRCLTRDKLQPIHDTLRSVAAAHGDEKGFVLLSWVGDALIKKNL